MIKYNHRCDVSKCKRKCQTQLKSVLCIGAAQLSETEYHANFSFVLISSTRNKSPSFFVRCYFVVRPMGGCKVLDFDKWPHCRRYVPQFRLVVHIKDGARARHFFTGSTTI